MGIDLHSPDSPEIDILNLRKSIVQGRLPRNRNEILMSESFAEKLGLSIGEKATLISSTMNGSMTIHNFRVVGTVRFGMVALDKSTIIADINDVRTALDMTDAASEIVGFTKDMVYADRDMGIIAQSFNDKYLKLSDEFSPIMQSLSGQGGLIKEMLKMVNTMGGIVVLVFVFVMSIVLWNAGLMNGIRRYGEIGVRLAMGEPKGGIYRSMIFESI